LVSFGVNSTTSFFNAAIAKAPVANHDVPKVSVFSYLLLLYLLVFYQTEHGFVDSGEARYTDEPNARP
jgi:hypothetical protein